MDYQLIVIGAGPGGYTAALRAARLGLHTAVVERREVGGTCLNRGCIPTKTLLHASQVYYDAVNGAGVGVHGSLSYDIGEMFAFKRSVSERLRSGIHALLKGAKVDVIEGTAQIAAPGQVDVTGADGAVTRYTAERILAATGSVNVRPPIPGAAGGHRHAVSVHRYHRRRRYRRGIRHVLQSSWLSGNAGGGHGQSAAPAGS